MSDTNAVKWLRAQGVNFRTLEYQFTEIGADHAAEAIGRPLEMVCRTLVLKATGNAYWVAIIPGPALISIPSAATAPGTVPAPPGTQPAPR